MHEKSEQRVKKVLLNFRKHVSILGCFFFLERASYNKNVYLKPEWQNHEADCEFLAAAGGGNSSSLQIDRAARWLADSESASLTLAILITSFPPWMAAPSRDAPLMMGTPSSCAVRRILSGHHCSSSSTQQATQSPAASAASDQRESLQTTAAFSTDADRIIKAPSFQRINLLQTATAEECFRCPGLQQKG